MILGEVVAETAAEFDRSRARPGRPPSQPDSTRNRVGLSARIHPENATPLSSLTPQLMLPRIPIAVVNPNLSHCI
jgi:hypothetical protein